jgi:hypothetical protein
MCVVFAPLAEYTHYPCLFRSVRLALGIGPFPLSYIVCASALGYNYRGRVYVNLFPLSRPRGADMASVEEDFLHVLLHEIAHWHQALHNEDFAVHFAQLVYTCRNCIEI